MDHFNVSALKVSLAATASSQFPVISLHVLETIPAFILILKGMAISVSTISGMIFLSYYKPLSLVDLGVLLKNAWVN